MRLSPISSMAGALGLTKFASVKVTDSHSSYSSVNRPPRKIRSGEWGTLRHSLERRFSNHALGVGALAFGRQCIAQTLIFLSKCESPFRGKTISVPAL